MKKNLIIILCVLFVVQLCEAQQYNGIIYLYTPNGSQVEAHSYGDLSSADNAKITSDFAAAYPQATVLADASHFYNCHSYAWNIIETEGVAYELNQLGNQNGGEDFIEALYSLGVTFCWIEGLSNVRKYWDDLSYIETTAADAEKVHYYNGDHSAVVSTTHLGEYESKWGPAPLMRHAPDYGPAHYNMADRRYYKKYCSGGVVNFTNKVIVQDTIVSGCIVNIQDVAVQNNSKLTVNEAKEVTINGPFEVKPGAQFEVIPLP